MTYLILEGLLHESGTFDGLRGYEDVRVEQAARIDHPNSHVTLSLVDAEGRVLTTVRPRVAFPTGCTAQATHAGVGFLRAALAHQAAARRLELRVHGRLTHSADVGSKPPEVRASATSPDANTVRISVEAQAQDDVRIWAELDDGRRLAPEVTLDGQEHVVDLRSLEGLDEATLLVERTERLRTTRAHVVRVDLPETSVRGHILEPLPDAHWPFGRRGGFIGNLSDGNGRPVAWDPQVYAWHVNGRPMGLNGPLAAWRAEAAGSYRIELVRTVEGGQFETLAQRELVVEEPTEEQKEYAAVAAAVASQRVG